MALGAVVRFFVFACLLQKGCLAQRADLCQRIDQIRNGSLAQDRALQGVHLHVGTGLYDRRFLRWVPDTQKWAGLEVDLLDKLAQDAGFTYTMVVRDWSNITDYTSAARTAVEEQDLVTNSYFYITPERMRLGMFSPYGFLDAMLYLVAAPVKQTGFSFSEIFSFLTPFSGGVWGLFLLLTLGTGLIFRFLEAGSNEEDYPDGALNCCHVASNLDSIFKSSGHVTGASAFTPKTTEGKILLTSWTWCIVLTLSAYTANLASFLVVRAETSAAFGSLQEAVAQKRSIVLEQGSAATSWFDSTHPDYSGATRSGTGPNERGKLITDNRYDAGLFAKFELDMMKQDADVNPDCNLQLVGEPLINMQAGWMVLNDVSDKCTTLVRDVLAIWFLRMDLDGSLIEKVRSNLIPSESCPTVVSQNLDETTPLDIDSMLGIMIFHAAGVMISLLLRCGKKSASKVVTKSRTGFFSEAQVAVEEPKPAGDGHGEPQQTAQTADPENPEPSASPASPSSPGPGPEGQAPPEKEEVEFTLPAEVPPAEEPPKAPSSKSLTRALSEDC